MPQTSAERGFPPVAHGAVAPEGNVHTAIQAVHEHVVATYGEPTEFTTSYVLAPNDDYGWADGESPVLQWEEGPYEWAYEVTQNEDLINTLADLGLFIESATSWAIGFYTL